jgi:hypothetical protein
MTDKWIDLIYRLGRVLIAGRTLTNDIEKLAEILGELLFTDELGHSDALDL